ncbi:MAG: glycosyltransferase family 9 protein [Ignavibacteriaceae bacterium]
MNKTGKILIVKIGAIGDVVMALSMIKAAEYKFPGAEITWVCGKIVEPILRSFPQISSIIVVNEKNLLTGNYFLQLFEIIRTWSKISFKKYDLVLVPYRDSRYKLLTLFTFKKKMRDMTGTDRLNTFIPGRYHSAEYAKLILENDDWEMQEPGFPAITVIPDDLFKDEVHRLEGKRVILNPGGAKNLLNGGELRRWPIEYYKLLAESLLEKGISVFLIGSEKDKWVLDFFSGMNIKSFIGRTNLTDLVYLFQKCDILVTHDTGAFHLAKLTNIRIIGLFGPVNPSERTGIKENINIIYKGNDLACSPCYDGKNFANCDNNICMKSIEATQVYDTIIKYLS